MADMNECHQNYSMHRSGYSFVWNFLELFLIEMSLFFLSLSTIRYFSSRSANCCIHEKKARSQKTRVKTDTRISSPVSLAATRHFLSLQLPVERMTQIDTKHWEAPAGHEDLALIVHSLSIDIMCDLRKLQVFCWALITVWLVFFSWHNSGGNHGNRSRYSWLRLHQC